MSTTTPFPSATSALRDPHSRRARLPGSLRRAPSALVLIVLVAALQSLAWDIALPAFQGPDEDTHFAYIQYLAETGHLPGSSSGTSVISSEVESAVKLFNLRATMGNLGSRPAWSAADLQLWRKAERELPKGSRANGDGPNPIAKNPPLYYAVMAVPYRLLIWLPLLKRLFVLRLFNAIFYIATIILTWLIAGELFGRTRWKQALASGAVALQPQLASMSAVINADNLLIALTSAFLFATLRLVRRGPTTPSVLTCAALASATVLTHGRGLVTLPVLAVAYLAAWFRFRPSARQTLTRGGAATAVLAAGFGTYFVLSRSSAGGSLYGGEVSGFNSGGFNLRQFLSSIYQFYFPKLPSLQSRIGPEYGYRQVFINTFYAIFGSLEIMFKQWVYDTLQVLSALGLVAFYTACVTNARRLQRAWPAVTVMLMMLLTTLFFLHYVSYRALLGDAGQDPLIVGRYLLPIVSLFGVAIAFTAGALPRRAGALLGAAILSLGVLLSLGSIAITAGRFYA